MQFIAVLSRVEEMEDPCTPLVRLAVVRSARHFCLGNLHLAPCRLSALPPLSLSHRRDGG